MHGGLRTTDAAPRQSEPGAPLVSIITVVRNGAAHVEQAITSVLNQSYRNFEYIVIDGGSTDTTLDIIRKYEDRIDYWLSETDRGIYHAMNKGLKLAGGELIGLLNADDFYESDALAQVVACWRPDQPAIYYGDNLVLQEDLGITYRRRASLRYWLGMSICHQAMFVHAAIYRQLQGYRTGYRLAADYDFLLRAVSAGVALVPVPAFLVTYRDTGLTSRHYAVSLAEAKRINRDSFGRFSRYHAAYLASYCKTMLLYHLQQLLLKLLGRSTVDRLRSWYLRMVLLRSGDIRK